MKTAMQTLIDDLQINSLSYYNENVVWLNKLLADEKKQIVEAYIDSINEDYEGLTDEANNYYKDKFK